MMVLMTLQRIPSIHSVQIPGYIFPVSPCYSTYYPLTIPLAILLAIPLAIQLAIPLAVLLDIPLHMILG